MKNSLRLARESLTAPVLFAGAAVFGSGGGLLVIGQAWLLSQMISRVYLGGAGLLQVKPMLLWLLAVILLRAVLTAASEISSAAAAVQVKNRLRKDLLERIFRAGPVFTQNQRSGELTAQAVQGMDALDPFFSAYLPQLVLAAVVPLGILLFVAPLDWLTGLVFLLTAPLIPVFMVLIGRMAEALTKRQFSALSAMSAYFLDTLQGLVTLKLLGQSQARAARTEQVSQRYRRTTLEVLRVTFLSALVLELVATISTALVAVQIGLRLLYGQVGFEQALLILFLSPEFYLPLRLLGQRFHAGMSGTAAAEKLYQVMDEADRAAAARSGLADALLRGAAPDIVFEHVSCAYPGRDVEALIDINLTIPAGKLTAVVGASGAGKTTLAWLLMGFLQPHSGQILADGRRIDLAGADWRRQTAWVPQAPTIFHGSLRENICLGEAQVDRARLERAVAAAGLSQWVAELPRGLETSVGEQGSLVSGGQAQRIALARAFYRDSRLVILDEPTSYLDADLESQLERSILELCRGKTALMIAHRISPVLKADHVILLSQGRVAESGSPAELLVKEGLFASFVHAAGGGMEQ